MPLDFIRRRDYISTLYSHYTDHAIFVATVKHYPFLLTLLKIVILLVRKFRIILTSFIHSLIAHGWDVSEHKSLIFHNVKGFRLH